MLPAAVLPAAVLPAAVLPAVVLSAALLPTTVLSAAVVSAGLLSAAVVSATMLSAGVLSAGMAGMLTTGGRRHRPQSSVPASRLLRTGFLSVGAGPAELWPVELLPPEPWTGPGPYPAHIKLQSPTDSASPLPVGLRTGCGLIRREGARHKLE